MIDRRPITLAFIELLARSTGKEVYVAGAVPATAAAPFIVVAGSPAEPSFDESLADDYSTLRCNYIVTSVGERHDQAEALADRVRRTVCQRAVDGGWQVDFAELPPAIVIIGRESVSAGGVDTVGQMPNVTYNFPEEFALYAAAS